MTIRRRQVTHTLAPRGAVLVLVLLVLALFSVIALWWVVRAGLQEAGAIEYQRGLALRTAADSALEHAKASVADVALLPAEADSGWIVLASSATEQASYRLRVRDTAAMAEQELPWPAHVARCASAVVRTDNGWRRVADPYIAAHDTLRDACAQALRAHGADTAEAPSLALALADAYDDNLALAEQDARATGFEGLMLAGARRGDERVLPVAQILRQSAFYDVDYERDNFAIFGAFAIDAVEPVVESAWRTNTRVRLATRLADPVRQRQWETFQQLWHEVYPDRFIPHAWRGQRALIVMECGGASTALTVRDNDGEWLYFDGYPLSACVRGRYVSIKLCSEKARPGCLTAVARGVPDVWFVTGLQARAVYRLQWYGEGGALQPDYSVVLGTGRLQGEDTLVHAKHDAVGVQVTLAPELRISMVRLSQPDIVAWRYTGAQPLQASGWQWQRSWPEQTLDTLQIVSNTPASALVKPGTLWLWSTGEAGDAPRKATISFVTRDEAGMACLVRRAEIVPSPHGGWAWRITARVHPDYRWTPGYWRGAACVRAADSNLTTRSAFLVMDNTHNTLFVHAGTRAMAEDHAPLPGTWLRMGGLIDAMRRAHSMLVNPLGQTCARQAAIRSRAPAGAWMCYDNGHWRAGIPVARLELPTNNTPAARIMASPAWQRAATSAPDPQALAAALDTLIQPHGIDLPVNAGAAPGGWMATRTRLRRTGATAWRFARGGVRWPADFWRGAEVIFPGTDERARVRASQGDTLELDRTVRAPSRCTATLAPLAGIVFHVTANAAADATWEWRVPEDTCGPYELYVRGFCPPSTADTARLTIAAFNTRTSAFEPLVVNAVFDQHDVIAAGTLHDDHLDVRRQFRLRLTARGAPVWVRGVYLVPAARRGCARHELAGHVSDAFAVELSARITRHGEVAAQWDGTALLQRTWQGSPNALCPVLRCVQLRWQPGGSN